LAFADHEAEDTRAIRPDALVVRRGHAGATEEALEEEVPGVIEERKLGAECDAWSESRCLRAGEVDQREPGVGLLNKPPVETPERSERNAVRPASTSGASGSSGLVANVTPGARPRAWSPWRITNVSAPPRSIQMPSSNAATFGPARNASKATWPVAIDARGGTAVVLELAEERDVRRRAGGVVPRDGDPAKNDRPRGRPRLRGEGRQCDE